MGKLWGSQSHYDSNHDGRLSSREWDNWYWGTYGVDIELSERKRAQQVKSRWAAWLNRALEMMDSSYSTVHANAGKLLGHRASEELANKTFVYWITYGLVDGSAWNTAWNTNTGAYVSNTTFYPARSLVKEFLNRHPELGSYEAVEDAARSGRTLHEEIGALNGSDCGLFWKAMIGVLPPYREEAIQDFDIISSFTPYDNAEDAEKTDTLRELMQMLFPIYGIFVKEPNELVNERHRRRFEECWKKFGVVEHVDEEEELKAWEYNDPTAGKNDLPEQEMPSCSASEKKASEDDGALYRFCTVKFPDIARPYTYLCDDAVLKEGDFVLAPFGRKNTEKVGVVLEVGQYTASNAPHPPRQTKAIVRKAERPGHWNEK